MVILCLGYPFYNNITYKMKNLIIIKNKQNRIHSCNFIAQSLLNSNNTETSIDDFIEKLQQALGYHSTIKIKGTVGLSFLISICYKYNDRNVIANVNVPIFYFI